MTESSNFQRSQRTWTRKFTDAFRGIRIGIAGQSSFVFHFLAAIAVLLLATILRLPLERWCLLVLCIGIVVAAELFNSSLESICRCVTTKFDPDIERALNIASGSVLVVSITSAVIGAMIFLDSILHLTI